LRTCCRGGRYLFLSVTWSGGIHARHPNTNRTTDIGGDYIDVAGGSTDMTAEHLKMEPAHFDLAPNQAAWAKELASTKAAEGSSGLDSLQRFLQNNDKRVEIPVADPPLDGDMTGCRVHGVMPIRKVAANFHITAGKSIHHAQGRGQLSLTRFLLSEPVSTDEPTAVGLLFKCHSHLVCRSYTWLCRFVCGQPSLINGAHYANSVQRGPDMDVEPHQKKLSGHSHLVGMVPQDALNFSHRIDRLSFSDTSTEAHTLDGETQITENHQEMFQ
jgi:hypothetical protein